MKVFSIILTICLALSCTYSSASDAPPENPLSPEELSLLENCNLNARNSLISEDIALVKNTCMQAINTIDKSHQDKKYLINPIMNLAFAYSLAGQFDKANPLYDRALTIGNKSFPADSWKLKEIRDVVNASKNMKGQSGK